MRKCAVPNCPKQLPEEYSKKTCPHCLQLASIRNARYHATQRGKTLAKARSAARTASGYEQTAARKAAKKRRWREPKAVARTKTDEYRARRKVASRKYNQSPKGITQSKSMLHRLGVKICGMLDGSRPDSVTVRELCGFANRQEAADHFEASWDRSWMTWQNHGVRKVGDGPRTKWHIGHRIPKAAYDPSCAEDMRRCWNRINLFAQDAVENQANSNRILPPDAELLRIQSIWPTSWNDWLPLRD